MNFEKIGNVAEFINGVAFKPSDWNSHGTKIIRIQNLTDPSKPYNRTNRTVEEKYIVKKGDVLVSWSATINVFIWNDEDSYLNQHIFKVNFDKEKVDESYFVAALKFTIADLSKCAHGSTMKHVVKNDFENHKIPLPSIHEQKIIASILNSSQKLISKRKESIRLLDEFLKSTFLEMFGDPVRNEKGWRKLDGGNYCEKLTVGVVIKPASYYVKEGVIAIRSLNVRPNAFDLKNVVYFSKRANQEELSKSILSEGDVVFVRTGVTGTAAIVPKELNGCNCIDLIIARPKLNLVHARYLTFFFNSEFGKQLITSLEVGGIQKHFNVGAIKSLKIPLPPIDLQNEFAIIANNTERLKLKYVKSLYELENLYSSLSQKAFKGELRKS